MKGRNLMKLEKKTLLFGGIAALAFGVLAGCDDTAAGVEEDTEEAAYATEQAGEEVAEGAVETGEAIEEGTEEAINETGEAVADAGREIDAEEMALDIEMAIMTDPVMDSDATEVYVENESNTLFLRGTVGSQEMVEEALEIANAELEDEGAMYDVVSELRVL
jgi:hypothetical protein